MRLLLLILLLTCFQGLGQPQNYVVSVTLKNSEGHPVSSASLYYKGSPDDKVRSNSKGQAYIKYKAGNYDTLLIKHAGYQDDFVYISKKAEKRAFEDTIYFTVIMKDRVTAGVNVYATQVPDTLFGTQEYSVEDFEFDAHGNLVLLTYEKNLESGSVLRLIGADNKELDKFYLDGRAVELQTDFRNNIHLVMEEKVYLVMIHSQRFEIYLEDRDYYFRYVTPVIDTIDQNIYFSNYSQVYPAFEYFEFNRADSVYNCILRIEDTFMMEMYRSEFKYVDVRTKIWAAQKQLETGIDKEIWVGATVFVNSLYYEPLYAPLFKIGSDSILVFDHYLNQMVIYRPGFGRVDSVDIDYHLDARKTGWEQPLIQDEVTGKVYALFERNGHSYLQEINLEKGTIEKSFRLYFRYVERIKIVNGEVFYIYRPYESIQKKYIYRERLTI